MRKCITGTASGGALHPRHRGAHALAFDSYAFRLQLVCNPKPEETIRSTGNSVRATMHQRSTDVIGDDGELAWPFADTRERSIDIVEEPLGEPGSLPVVRTDCARARVCSAEN
jgi:hypothetical protein